MASARARSTLASSMRCLSAIHENMAGFIAAAMDIASVPSGKRVMGGVRYAFFSDPDENSRALQQIPR